MHCGSLDLVNLVHRISTLSAQPMVAQELQDAMDHVTTRSDGQDHC